MDPHHEANQDEFIPYPSACRHCLPVWDECHVPAPSPCQITVGCVETALAKAQHAHGKKTPTQATQENKQVEAPRCWGSRRGFPPADIQVAFAKGRQGERLSITGAAAERAQTTAFFLPEDESQKDQIV